MKKVNTKTVAAIMLVALIMGLSPACAVAASANFQTLDPMDVKGKGVDAEAASQITEQVEDGQTETNIEVANMTADMSNTATEQNTAIETPNAVTEPDTTTNDNSTPVVNDQVTEDVQIPDLNINLENDTTVAENETIPQIDTTGIVMQSTNHTCGPAALATVLNNLGINTTEQELATLAGTDENGTTMYGLVEAAKAKGFNGVGMKLLVDDLKPNNIVFVTIDGGPHYSVVREVTNESVKLADPSLGNIEMSREDFTAAYSGNALVITDPNNSTEVNGTTEQTKNETDTNSTNVQADNSKILIDEEMQNIKGKHALIPVWVKGWFWSWYEWKYGRHTHIFPAGTVKGSSTAWLFYRHEGWYQKWGWYRKIYGWHVVRIWCWTLPWNYVGFFTPPWPYYG